MPPCLYALPEHHHVHGVVREAGDERSHRDDGDDGDEKMRAAVGTRSRLSMTLTPRDAPAVGVELKEKQQASFCRRNRTQNTCVAHSVSTTVRLSAHLTQNVSFTHPCEKEPVENVWKGEGLVPKVLNFLSVTPNEMSSSGRGFLLV